MQRASYGKFRLQCLAALPSLLFPATAVAQWEGSITVEGRMHLSSAHSLRGLESAVRANLRRRVHYKRIRSVLDISARVDPARADRIRFDVNDLSFWFTARRWDLAFGFREIFWGTLESRNLVDVVNQLDPERGWLRQEKLGQPMISVGLQSDLGKFEFYVLLWSRPRPFGGLRNALWGASRIEGTSTRYTQSEPLRQLAWAIRFARATGPLDLGLSLFDGTTRDPQFDTVQTDDTVTAIPVYRRIRQVGLEMQYTGPSWLWKLETISNHSSSGTYVSVGSGVEYLPADYLSFFGELLFDSRGRSATTSLERDLYLGTRIYYPDGSIIAASSVDLRSANIIGGVGLTRRITNGFTLEIDFSAFIGSMHDEPPFAIREPTSVTLGIRRYF